MKPVAAIILAAGASSRMGSPKQLATLNAERLLNRAVRIAEEAGCLPVVVLGARAVEISAECHLECIRTIVNPRWEDGMSSSIAEGIACVQESADAVVLMTCDQPAVTPEHLRKLIAAGTQMKGPVASSYAGRSGVPAYFPGSHFDLLCALRGDAGARELLVNAYSIPLTRGELDIDTPEKLMEAQSYLSET